VYLLQRNDGGQWSLMSLYQTVGAVGEVSHASLCPMGQYSVGKEKSFFETSFEKDVLGEKLQQQHQHLIGLLFVASRLGDSSLLGYALGETSVVDALKTEPGLGNKNVKTDNVVIPTKEEDANRVVKMDGDEEDYERILELEEDALYAGTDSKEASANPDIVPPSDDDDDEHNKTQRAKRARFSNMLVVRSLRVLDSLTSLGPLGPACLGPLAPSPETTIDPTISSAKATSATTTTGQVFPCGYGSSGGLALLSVPGRDARNILAEADCINAKALFSLPRRDLVLMAMSPDDGGTKVFKLEGDDSTTKHNLTEVNLTKWCPNEDTRDFFEACHLLVCVDLTDDSFLVLVASPDDENSHSYFIIILQQQQPTGNSTTTVRMTAANQLDIPKGEFVTSAKAVEDQESDRVLLTYTLSMLGPSVVVITSDGSVNVKHSFAPPDVMSNFDDEVEIMSEEEKFYADRKIVSVDIFKAPKCLFASNAVKASQGRTLGESEQPVDGQHNTREVDLLDEDDKELYYESTVQNASNERKDELDEGDIEHDSSQATVEEDAWYFATSRQSGELDIFLFDDLNTPIWSCMGSGHGAPAMFQDQIPPRNPMGHTVYAREMKFFFCGPSSDEWGNKKGLAGPRPFCLMIETNDGDVQIYNADIHHLTLQLQSLSRVPLKDISRPSQESTKHFSKLRRKKIVSAKSGTESTRDFQHKRLFSFSNISGQDGAFASVSRPFWLVAERGKPTVLHHRCRHVAPAGARPRPIAGFCSGLSLLNRDESIYVTVHERVGRVGSQRMTLFDGILNLASKNSLLPGGGLFVEKIPFGVTVRKILFIDDGDPSSGSHPLYAVLVSREFEADLSELNDDGLSDEERQQIADEKENAKIQRQVEADLGGFDVEQEWVEEIERENCFKVDKELGGAPPVPTSAYSLWIVDVSNGWQVVDSYELEDFEHGTSMEVMALTEFKAEPGTDYDISEEDSESKYFIAVGAGTIDKDGEDVACKGRVLLFEVNRPKDASIAELNFVYEKRIFHGPITSLSCLTVEGKSRLIIGAGADVNVEQWGNDKLTQVGFFRATMQILDIKLFKNFFILSDAYDSLYFLVWRESDKSLTMLAKDYDPIPVYCSGFLSRGGSLDFVCNDDRQNLQFFQYAPGDPAARGGNKLVCRADFHLGSQTTDLQSHFCRSSLLINSATPASTLAALKQQDTFFGKAEDDQRLAVTFGTTDGGYCSVVPLDERVYWRLTALQSVLVNALESDCALSQRAWRLYRRASRRGGCRNNEGKKGVIDGDLVLQYTDLSKSDQEDLASSIGSTVDLILDNLLELRCSSMVL
jgi:cleavage and polyadenylation specificity factor subunit 1